VKKIEASKINRLLRINSQNFVSFVLELVKGERRAPRAKNKQEKKGGKGQERKNK